MQYTIRTLLFQPIPSVFQQILHLTPDYAGELIHRLRLGFVDVVDPLLVHLDGSEADAGKLRQLRRGQALAFPQLFQSALR